MIRLILIAFSILCCLAMFVKHSAAEIDPTTAVGVWLFNETDGDTASDSSENGNDGTLEGDPKWVPAGKFGNALELDGAGDYVSVPDHETLDTKISETFSIVIWVKGTYRPNDWHGLVTKAQGWRVDMCYLLQRAANGSLRVCSFWRRRQRQSGQHPTSSQKMAHGIMWVLSIPVKRHRFTLMACFLPRVLFLRRLPTRTRLWLLELIIQAAFSQWMVLSTRLRFLVLLWKKRISTP